MVFKGGARTGFRVGWLGSGDGAGECSWLAWQCWDRAPFIRRLETLASGAHSAKHKQGGLFLSYLRTMHHQNESVKKKGESPESGGPSVGRWDPDVVEEPLEE